MDRASLPELGSQRGLGRPGGPQTHLHLPGPQAGHGRRLAGRTHHEQRLLQGGAADAVEGQHPHRELPLPAGRGPTRGAAVTPAGPDPAAAEAGGSSRSHSLPVSGPAARWWGQAPARGRVSPAGGETSLPVGRWRHGLAALCTVEGASWALPGRLSTTLPPVPAPGCRALQTREGRAPCSGGQARERGGGPQAAPAKQAPCAAPSGRFANDANGRRADSRAGHAVPWWGARGRAARHPDRGASAAHLV